jgi:4-hydroxy-tetrahydrodipicolinate synthase
MSGSAESPASIQPANDGGRLSAFVISITPFDWAGGLDTAGFRAHLRRMGASGIGVYVGGGGSGEGYSLPPEDTRRLLEVAVDELKGTVPIRAMGVEPRTAEQMIDFTQMATEAGVDAVQIYSLDVGHGHVPTTEETELYLTEVLEAVEIPAIVSTHQSVGYQIAPPLLGELVRRYDQVVGVNCSQPSWEYIAAVIDAVGAQVDVHVGGPMQAFTALALGANGFMSSEANLAPNLCMSIIHAYRRGDLAAAMAAYGKLVRLSAALYGNGGIRVTKGILSHLGLAGGVPRKPRLAATQAQLGHALGQVESLGLQSLEGW